MDNIRARRESEIEIERGETGRCVWLLLNGFVFIARCYNCGIWEFAVGFRVYLG